MPLLTFAGAQGIGDVLAGVDGLLDLLARGRSTLEGGIRGRVRLSLSEVFKSYLGDSVSHRPLRP